MLAKRSKVRNDIADYLFFETLDGFHFESLSSWLRNDVLANYHYSIANQRENDYRTVEEKDFYQIENISTDDMINNLDNFRYGMYASNMHIVDIDSKTSQNIEFKYGDRVNDMVLLNNTSFTPYNDYTNSFYNIKIDPLRTYEYELYRKSILTQLDNLKINIQVPGDFNRHVGDIVSVRYVNESIDGNYIVTAINHSLDMYKHRMFLELSRNSYK